MTSSIDHENDINEDKIDIRFDPFTESDDSVAITGESHVIPGASPYYIQLNEVPKEDTPSLTAIRKIGQLDEDLDDSETGVDVVRGADWAVDDVFAIDSEKMQVTNVVSNTLTVTRGYDSTTPAAHNQYENVETGTLSDDGSNVRAQDDTKDFVDEGVKEGDIFENTTNSQTATITGIRTTTNKNDTLCFSTGTATSNDNGDSYVVKRPRLLIDDSDFTEVFTAPSAGEYEVHYGTADVPYKRGLIRFHEDDKDKTMQCDYTKTGHYNWAEFINDIQDALRSRFYGYDLRPEIITNEHLQDNIIEHDQMSNNAIHQAELYTTTAEVNTSSSNNLTLTGGTYIFYPQVKTQNTGAITFDSRLANYASNPPVSYVSNVYLSASSGLAYAQARYVRSSGHINWYYLLRDVKTKKIIASSIAKDHPCYGNGGKPELMQHPFLSVYTVNNKQYIGDDINIIEVEILVHNLSDEMYIYCVDESVIADNLIPDKSILEILSSNFILDDNDQPEWPKDEVIVGLPRHAINENGEKEVIEDWTKEYYQGRNLLIEPIKREIIQPSHIKTIGIKER